ncbi:hypothetical protein H8F21_13330 [Pseudomonas sp. P66]|uniref:Uncharacterized protein n=1 Tax=Pseudomonas arcuscaelestis TaxID=2710591 RepID=A0ABS2BYI6_9PSED|nr:hypothetical protein [Pseudomonas arcuscaelestis]MBM5458545.1 hypothetical protein [Pseudomonas arcuscaelestis]
MSTKINNGLILRNCTLTEALAKLQEIREEVVRKAQANVAMQIAERRYYWADMDQNFIPIPRKRYESFYWRILEIIKAERSRVLGENTRSPDWDYTLDVLLIPFSEHVLALYYLENNPGFTDLLTQAGFEDFHYQNSTDGPEDIPPADWDARKEAWNQALPSGFPCHAGLKFEMVSWHDISLALHDRDLIMRTKPDEGSRRMKVAMNLINTIPLVPGTKGMGIMKLARLAESLAAERAPHVILAEVECDNS